jgi:hypothetical protein
MGPQCGGKLDAVARLKDLAGESGSGQLEFVMLLTAWLTPERCSMRTVGSLDTAIAALKFFSIRQWRGAFQ